MSDEKHTVFESSIEVKFVMADWWNYVVEIRSGYTVNVYVEKKEGRFQQIGTLYFKPQGVDCGDGTICEQLCLSDHPPSDEWIKVDSDFVRNMIGW